jgi:hypothetical protein
MVKKREFVDFRKAVVVVIAWSYGRAEPVALGVDPICTTRGRGDLTETRVPD